MSVFLVDLLASEYACWLKPHRPYDFSPQVQAHICQKRTQEADKTQNVADRFVNGIFRILKSPYIDLIW